MQGFSTFARKEIREFFSTWRGKTIAIIVLLFAGASPVLAYVTPALLGSMVGSLGLKIPDPTYLDSYVQWNKNISQLVCIAVIIVTSGIIGSEIANGTAAMMLSKPLSRPAFVLSKFCVQIGFVSVLTIFGGVLCEVLTRVLFGTGDVKLLAEVTGIWIVFLILLIAMMTLLSSRLAALPGAGIGVAAFFALSLATLSKPLVSYTPAGMLSIPGKLVAADHVNALWPILTTIAFITLLVGATLLTFRDREI